MNRSLSEVVAVDTHCHVDLYPDGGQLLAEAVSKRILVVAVTNAPSVFFHTRKLAESCPYLLPAVGLHPELVGTHGHEVSMIRPMLEQTQFVGEVGLDYVTSDKELKTRQRKVFTTILDHCSALGGKVLTVHSRRAASDVVSTIGAGFNGKVILHWFTGTTREAERALDRGFYFSINTAMIVGKSSSQLLAVLPRERVLTETDGPFIKNGKIPVTPIQTFSVVGRLSELWQITEEETRAVLIANFGQITTHP